MNYKFAVFILSHGRPDSVLTWHTLRKQGYTGDIYIIVDNEDDTIDQYRERFGDDAVIVFDKKAVAATFDEAGRFEDRRVVVYARNASFDIAEQLGLDYFLQLDDDYKQFEHRFNPNRDYFYAYVNDLDSLFAVMVEFLDTSGALAVAFLQGGDYLGGRQSTTAKRIYAKRKAMNTFFCKTERRFQFLGRVNEDTTTYVALGHRGGLFLSPNPVIVVQRQTQSRRGGMTELYLHEGTYVKSFYPILFAPSCVKVGLMGDKHRRLHHVIDWNVAVPCIVSDDYRKEHIR